MLMMDNKLNHHSKKILFIIDDLGRGGAEKITADLASCLADQAHQVSVAVLSNDKTVQILNKKIHFIDLNIRSEFAFGKLWKNKKLNDCEKRTIDSLINSTSFDLIILGHHNGYYIYDELYQKDKVWHWIHAELIEFRNTQNPLKLLKEYLRQIRNRKKFKKLFNGKKCITVNSDLARRYQKLCPDSQLTNIANGTKIIAAPNPSQAYNKKWDCIFVGRLVAIKQVDHAIKAFLQSGLTGKMAIIGEGPERNRLEQWVRSLNTQDKVEFLGWIEQPKTYMQQSQCVIMSSFYEGSPVTLLEAISLNIPVVSYASSTGITDLFTEEYKALCLAEKQNIKELAQKLYTLVNHPIQYNTAMQRNISIDRMAEQFLQLTEQH